MSWEIHTAFTNSSSRIGGHEPLLTNIQTSSHGVRSRTLHGSPLGEQSLLLSPTPFGSPLVPTLRIRAARKFKPIKASLHLGATRPVEGTYITNSE